MGQATRRASPRITCPTDDDADGLRYLSVHRRKSGLQIGRRPD